MNNTVPENISGADQVKLLYNRTVGLVDPLHALLTPSSKSTFMTSTVQMLDIRSAMYKPGRKKNSMSGRIQYIHETSGWHASPDTGYLDTKFDTCPDTGWKWDPDIWSIHRLIHIVTHLAHFVLCRTLIQEKIDRLNKFCTKQSSYRKSGINMSTLFE